MPLKARYMKKDLADWARSAGLAIKMPPTVFPVNSVKAMRGCIWLGKDMVPFARAVFETYWGGDKDISQDSVLTEVCKSVGVDPSKFFAGIGEQAIKDQLKANTDEVMARGGFGSPTIFVGKTDMYFGNDRMPLIREACCALQGEGRLMPKAVVCRELGPPESLRLETFDVGAAGAGAGARRDPRRRDQFSRCSDGGGAVSAQAAIAVHAGRGSRRRRGRGQRRRRASRSATR